MSRAGDEALRRPASQGPDRSGAGSSTSPRDQQALELCQRVLEASSADETEVALDGCRDSFARYADEGPTQCADRERADLSVRVRFRDGAGYREARATTGDLSPDGWTAALDRATQLARESPSDPRAVPLEGGQARVRAGSYAGPRAGAGSYAGPRAGAGSYAGPRAGAGSDAGPRAGAASEKDPIADAVTVHAGWVRQALAACAEHDLAPAGLAQTSSLTCTLVNSAGREALARRTRAAFSLTASGPRGSGWAERIAARPAAVDAEAVVARAVEKARRNADPQPVEPGSYTVVLEPAAVSSMLLFASYHGFGAREVEEQSSFLCGRMGERVFAESIDIANDAAHPLHAGLGLDGEGTPVVRTPLVEAGVLTGPVTDTAFAARLGVPNTGNAVRQPSSRGPAARNVCVAPGSSSLEELVGGVERGLLVTQFHYTNMIDPREMMLTGMTRNGTFLIEDGELVGSVRNLRFTHSLLDVLAGVTGVGRELEVAGALFDGEIVAPALRVDGFRFTSAAEF